MFAATEIKAIKNCRQLEHNCHGDFGMRAYGRGTRGRIRWLVSKFKLININKSMNKVVNAYDWHIINIW